MLGECAAKKKLKALPRRFAVAFASLLVSLALIAGLSRPPGRYFYCESMGTLPFDPCAVAAADHEDSAHEESTASIRECHTDCCDVVHVPPAPRAVSAQTPKIPPPTLLAVLPAPRFPRVLPVAPPHAPISSFERWRVPPRPPGQARAQLMVFLT